MSDDESRSADNDPIAWFSDQYTQAVQALETIRAQAPTLLMMGNSGELRRFLDQFIDMSSRTAADAHEKNLARFADWFLELVRKAEQMKSAVEQRGEQDSGSADA